MAKTGIVRMDLGLSASESAEGAVEIRDQPFRILILGDFSGRANRQQFEPETIGSRRTFQLDGDGLDQLPGKVGAALKISVQDDPDGPSIALTFRELDDFHPDRLFENVEVFRHLRRLRGELLESATFAAAAREVSGWGAAKPEVPPSAPAAEPATSAFTGGSLLDFAVAATEDAQAVKAGHASAAKSSGSFLFDELIREAVGPYIVPAADPRQSVLVACVDAAIANLMGRLLHHPAFQELEANWLSLRLLTRRLEINSQLQVHLVDVAQGELLADLESGETVLSSGCYQRIMRAAASSTTGGAPWSLILGSYTFGADVDDVLGLVRLAQIGSLAGTPFIAAAHSTLVSCPSFGTTPDADDWNLNPDAPVQQVWNEMRKFSEAAYVGLAQPRFLLRAPYGQASGTTETFAYEELSGPRQHEHFLWGNSAFLCACALGNQFSAEGPDGLTPDAVTEFDSLPLYVFMDDDGESQMLPCAEAFLRDRAATRIAEHGLISLRSVPGRDAVILNRLRSIAADGSALTGRWNR